LIEIQGETKVEILGHYGDDGIKIRFRDNTYEIIYPNKLWSNYPTADKAVLLDHLTYVTTIHLPLVFSDRELLYNTALPFFEPYFFKNLIMDFPSCAEVDGTNTSDLIRQFMNLKVQFKDNKAKFPQFDVQTSENSSVVALSFGKDSLLTYAVAQEINLHPKIVYIIEPSMKYEEKHKTLLAEKFYNEFGVKLHKITHTVGQLRNYEYLNVAQTELGWGLQSTEYALELLPLAYEYQAKYLLFGNEQSCGEYTFDKEGFINYPAYDQSHNWTVQISAMTQSLTNRNVWTVSLIEPLNDIAVMYVLQHRYPEIGKYEMSCFTETEAGRDTKWCHSCSVCGKMYLLLVAAGFDPKHVGFTKNMLSKEFRNYFSLFGGKKVHTYALTGLGFDEQLFAFYLASKRGNKSDLVLEFENSPLYEKAKEREEELYNIFLSIHKSITLPPDLFEKVFEIYKEEVESFEY